ncbi:MAG: universal stress protein [Azospirillaceae bacterium]
MALRNIMVTVDAGKACGKRLDYAFALADAHGAHVTGINITPVADIPAYIVTQLNAEAIRMHDQALAEMQAKAKAAFEESAARNGYRDRSDYRQEVGDPTEVASRLARCTDLVVAGQRDPDDRLDGMVDAEGLVMVSGRPVLLVPFSFAFKSVGSHPLVAWNGSREAARAVADALPLLEKSERTTVLVVNPGSEMGDTPGTEITLHLARHGIKAESDHILAKGISTGDVLLNNISDRGCDLLVMGAYGTPRMRELVLGGVTRNLLHHMTVPVLMSH